MSAALRTHLYLLAASYAVTGGIMFLAPAWAAANFAWKVSPFVTMTIGAWCLGNSWLALTAARRASWPTVFCPILYLALFGIFETGVLVAFRERVLVASPVAWLYLATIAATALLAVTAFADGWLRRPVLAAVGAPLGPAAFAFTIAFILSVGFLGLYGLLAVEGMRGLNASIFPEQISMLSLRAFGAFYLALALAVVPLLWARGRANVLTHSYAAYALVVLITAAAIVFIGQFDFAGRPTQAIYLGIYLLVGTVNGFYLMRYGTGAEKA
jgi:hypothetical protein